MKKYTQKQVDEMLREQATITALLIRQHLVQYGFEGDSFDLDFLGGLGEYERKIAQNEDIRLSQS